MTRDEEIRQDLERQWREVSETTSQHLLNPADFADFLETIKDLAQRHNAPDRQRSSAGGIVLGRRSPGSPTVKPSVRLAGISASSQTSNCDERY